MPNQSKGSVRRDQVPMRLVLGGLVIAGALLVGPFVLQGNELALALFGVLVALLTTLLSVYATHWYAESSSKGELTRYGLQAWRNLDSLQIKVSQQTGVSGLDDRVLAGWLLDIDQSKWAWQDLLREVFDLQARLQAETNEVAARYKPQIESAVSPAVKSQLELKQASELAGLASKAPLPLRVPVDVTCPRCRSAVTGHLGQSTGETAWPICRSCQYRFPIHRQPDGGVKVGEPDKVAITVKCPACQSEMRLWVSEERDILFVTSCPSCKTHIQFDGTAGDHSLKDLKVTNAEFACPECGKNSPVWVSPGRRVRFLANCELCKTLVQIVSDGETVHANKVEPGAAYQNVAPDGR